MFPLGPAGFVALGITNNKGISIEEGRYSNQKNRIHTSNEISQNFQLIAK